jgi:hypothetical protein
MFGRRLAFCLFAAILCFPGAARAQSPFRLRTILQENVRTDFGTFRNVAVQGVTRQGRILFLAVRPEWGDDDEDDQGLFLWNGDRMVRLIGRDDEVPGGEIIEITRATVAPRNPSARAFVATIRTSGGATETALFVEARDDLRRIATVGKELDGLPLLSISDVEGAIQVNAQGEVLLSAALDVNGDGVFIPDQDALALLLYTGGEWRRLARTGGPRAGGQTLSITFDKRALNDQGRVAWEERVIEGITPTSVVVISHRGREERVLRSGDPLLVPQSIEPRDPIINEAGNVALLVTIDRDEDGSFDEGQDDIHVILFRAVGSPTSTILLRSSRLERGKSRVTGIDALSDRNEAVVFATGDTDNDGVTADEDDLSVAWVASIAGVRALARSGRRMRLGDDARGGELILGTAISSNSDLAAITAIVDGDDNREFNPPGDAGILLASAGFGTVAVARDRQSFPSPIIEEGQILQIRRLEGITDANVIVFTADLDRNRDFRITPDEEGLAIFLAIPAP